MPNTRRTIRYLRSWLRGAGPLREETLGLEREDRTVVAKLVRPLARPGDGSRVRRHPGWIVLHGVTRPGIEHPQLVRFARALASTGASVIIPEVPEWKELRLAPGATLPTLQAAVRTLKAHPQIADAPYGLVGFSFGGPQALIAASHESVAPDLAGIVAFGGYCDLERTIRFQLTGEHEWRGRVEHIVPDPYGRWVVGANYLTEAEGYADAGDVAEALWALAAFAGDHGAPAVSPVYDEMKAKLRARLAPARRGLFDVFAPRSNEEPGAKEVEAVASALASGSRRIDPLMDPKPFLGRLRHPLEMLHGRGDTLIPYTESLRVMEHLPEGTRARLTVTRLFAHAKGDRFPLMRGPAEVWGFFRALARILDTV